MRAAKKNIFFSILAVIATFVFVQNTNLFEEDNPTAQSRLLMAHRGIHQTFHREQMTKDTCTAARIITPSHHYIENTLPSIAAAFKAGATMVELDIRITKDKKLAVFHDDTLNCRTNGTGKPWQYTMAELKTLDIAYGYTADQGKSFPLRGKGVGMMPSLKEVLATFPTQSFLINVKTRNPLNGDLLATLLKNRTPEQNNNIIVYGGGGAPTKRLRELMPEIRSFTRVSVKTCVRNYLLFSWTGVVPQACKNTAIMVPMDYAYLLWGWPQRFVQRMNSHNTEVFLMPSYQAMMSFGGGIDSKALIDKIPPHYHGGIWTNRIEIFND